MVTAPTLSGTSTPVAASAGVMVRMLVTGVPGAMVTEETPAGLLVKESVLTVKLPSSVVLRAEPVKGAPVELKMTSVPAPGVAPALLLPARSVVQLVLPALKELQLLSPNPLRQN